MPRLSPRFQAELKAKLEDDGDLQAMLRRCGLETSVNIMEQLDLDGDGEITWMEFEMMLAPLLAKT